MTGAATKAVLLSEYGQRTRVVELEIPSLEPGALVVEVSAATMCGTDVHIASGALSYLSRIPLVLGHEAVGRIVEQRDRTVDALGRPLRPGDLISWTYGWCRKCYWCTVTKELSLCPAARLYGWGTAVEFPFITGAFSQYVYVLPQCDVLKVPSQVPERVAASATCALRTVVHAFERVGWVAPGDCVVIQGSGPVGLYAAAFAASSGAEQVLLIGAPDDRLAIGTSWGATSTISIAEHASDERQSIVLEATGGRGADVVFECSGAQSAIEEGVGLLRRGGRYSVVGQVGGGPVTITGSSLTSKGISITGVRSGEVAHYERAFRFMSRKMGDIPFEALLGNDYSLDDVNAALESMASMREVKPVIVPSLSRGSSGLGL